MRLLERDKQDFWYATYISRTMLTEGNQQGANYTGERSTTYGTPTKASGTFSENVGAATPREFGTYIDYDYVIHMDRMEYESCPFDENAAIWRSNPTVTVGQTTTIKDPEYRVMRISENRTYIAVAIREMR